MGYINGVEWDAPVYYKFRSNILNNKYDLFAYHMLNMHCVVNIMSICVYMYGSVCGKEKNKW